MNSLRLGVCLKKTKMDFNNVHGTMISEKTNKIRWRPDPFNNSHSFLTGSWDNIENTIKLWDFQEKEDDPDIFPFAIKSFPFEGCVTEMKVC